eukprot:1179465-Prorocentrum_minimum.AAC.6
MPMSLDPTSRLFGPATKHPSTPNLKHHAGQEAKMTNNKADEIAIHHPYRPVVLLFQGLYDFYSPEITKRAVLERGGDLQYRNF